MAFFDPSDEGEAELLRRLGLRMEEHQGLSAELGDYWSGLRLMLDVGDMRKAPESLDGKAAWRVQIDGVLKEAVSAPPLDPAVPPRLRAAAALEEVIAQAEAARQRVDEARSALGRAERRSRAWAGFRGAPLPRWWRCWIRPHPQVENSYNHLLRFVFSSRDWVCSGGRSLWPVCSGSPTGPGR